MATQRHLERVEKILFYLSDIMHDKQYREKLGENELEALFLEARLATKYYGNRGAKERSVELLEKLEKEVSEKVYGKSFQRLNCHK